MSKSKAQVQFNAGKHKFEMEVDGKNAFIDFKQQGDTIDLIHTEVDEDLEGSGVAADLVEKTFEYLDAHQLKMIPSCTYIQHYLSRHPEWNKLVANA